jgi:hypothetical protein
MAINANIGTLANAAARPNFLVDWKPVDGELALNSH